jgi:hypothetical protein
VYASAQLIAHLGGGDLAVGTAREADGLGVVDGFGSEAPVALQGLEHEPRIVHLGIPVEPGALQVVPAQVGAVGRHVVCAHHAEARAALEAVQRGVGPERGAHLPQGHLAPTVGGEEEGNGPHQVRVGAHQEIALAAGLAHDAQVPVGQVAQAAVHELRRTARSARGEVAALDQQRAQPARRGVPQDARARDASAHYQQVDSLARGAAQGVTPTGQGPGAAHGASPSAPGPIAPSASRRRISLRILDSL